MIVAMIFATPRPRWVLPSLLLTLSLSLHTHTLQNQKPPTQRPRSCRTRSPSATRQRTWLQVRAYSKREREKEKKKKEMNRLAKFLNLLIANNTQPKTTTVLDESAQTLFLTELWRGLSLTLRAFFEKKATINYPFERAPCPRASEENTPCAATRRARSAASPASSARPSAPHRPSPSRPRSARTGRAGPRATTST